jgi:hypothetical protein
MWRLRSRGDVTLDSDLLMARARGVAVQVSDSSWLEGAGLLVQWLLARPGFTEGWYGWWPVALRDGQVFERGDALRGWVPGADRAVCAWEVQRYLCSEVGSGFEPPRADATAIVAPGALERADLTVVRYEYLAPQSGWYIGGDRGEREPLFDVIEEQPDLLELLALEPGWRATLDPSGTRVRRDRA